MMITEERTIVAGQQYVVNTDNASFTGWEVGDVVTAVRRDDRTEPSPRWYAVNERDNTEKGREPGYADLWIEERYLDLLPLTVGCTVRIVSESDPQQGWVGMLATVVRGEEPMGVYIHTETPRPDGLDSQSFYWPAHRLEVFAPAPEVAEVPVVDERPEFTVELHLEALLEDVRRDYQQTTENLAAAESNRVREVARVYAEWSSEWERLGERLNELATEEGLCNQYDRAVESLNGQGFRYNLPTREQEYEVEVTYTCIVTRTVTASDEDSAVEQIDQSDVDDMVRDYVSSGNGTWDACIA